ncbi:unnamed protein product [Cuscuta campestris]|uniref:Uncharacterized protein n=1 Tax=Cuscuta campestris TaxID=132261 RepID=A0A484KG35_9ASTE|nr:unnamed protein product [Cuscuta campestris]
MTRTAQTPQTIATGIAPKFSAARPPMPALQSFSLNLECLFPFERGCRGFVVSTCLMCIFRKSPMLV